MDRELIKAVRREYRRRLRELGPAVERAVAEHAKRPGVVEAADYALPLVAAQNVIRNCIEATLQQAMPQGQPFFGELAVRLACTVLTALPLDDQEVYAMKVRDAILPKLADMQANGHGIQTEWK